MTHFDPATREIENGWVEFQVKATDRVQLVKRGTFAVCKVDAAHVRQWYYQVAHPFILVLYDAQKHRAFWLDVQAHIDESGMADDDSASETIRLRIPVRNKLTPNAIEHFRRLSLARNPF
nr:hypothetical protein [uncultured bacterium]